MIASGVICIIYVLCAIVLFFGVKEKKGKDINISIKLAPSFNLDTITRLN